MGYVWNLITQQGTLVLSVPNPTKIGVLKVWSAYPWPVQGHTRLFLSLHCKLEGKFCNDHLQHFIKSVYLEIMV